VRLENDRVTESVILRRLTRPDAFDTFFASERVLEVLRPGSLTKVAKVLFFARWNRDGVGGEDADRVRVCLLIEGEARAVLFDQVGFSVAATSRVAEVAGMMVAAFAFHRDKLFYLDQVLEDTTVAALEEAVPRLRSLPWQKLDHPAAFFDVFDDWEGRLMAFAERPGHLRWRSWSGWPSCLGKTEGEIQGACHGCHPDGVPVAVEDMVFHGDRSAAPPCSQIDQTHGLGVGSAAGPGNARHRQGDVHRAVCQHAFGHGTGDRFADGPMRPQRRLRNPQHRLLRPIAVGDETAVHHVRRAGDFGKQTGDQAAGAGFRRGESEVAPTTSLKYFLSFDC